MKRRNFIAGTTGILLGQAAAVPASAQTQTTGISSSRTSRLFDNTLSTPKKTFVQDLFLANELVYCLYRDSFKRNWGLTATTTAGEQVSHFDLPKGTYLSVGAAGSQILLHALNYYDGPDHAQPHCLLSLSPDGSVSLIPSMGPGFTGKVFFAENSAMIRINSGALELWKESGSAFHLVTSVPSPVFNAVPHFDVLSADLVALTRPEGDSTATVDLQTGVVTEHPIVVPEVVAAIAKYQAQGNSRGNPIVIPATGSNHQGSVYALVFPSPPSNVQSVMFNSAGQGSLWQNFQFPPRATGAAAPVAIKILLNGSEAGIAYADGRVGWYAF